MPKYQVSTNFLFYHFRTVDAGINLVVVLFRFTQFCSTNHALCFGRRHWSKARKAIWQVPGNKIAIINDVQDVHVRMDLS